MLSTQIDLVLVSKHAVSLDGAFFGVLFKNFCSLPVFPDQKCFKAIMIAVRKIGFCLYMNVLFLWFRPQLDGGAWLTY